MNMAMSGLFCSCSDFPNPQSAGEGLHPLAECFLHDGTGSEKLRGPIKSRFAGIVNPIHGPIRGFLEIWILNLIVHGLRGEDGVFPCFPGNPVLLSVHRQYKALTELQAEPPNMDVRFSSFE